MADDDAARLLADSPDRWRVLTRLADEPGAPADLASALPLSRRSVQRHLRQFADREWVEKRDGAYHLTTTGSLVVAEHETYLEALQAVEDHADVLRLLPDAAHAPDPRWLAAATVTRASASNPQAPLHRYVDAIGAVDADRVRMLSPVLSRLFHDVHADLALEDTHTELVLPAATLERAREMNPQEFDVVASVDVLDVYRYPGDLSFGLTLGGDRVLLGAYDDDGHLHALVESTEPAFREWGRELFERYREGSEPVDPPGSISLDGGDE
jgi:predicted transcriptional regulator